MRTLVSYLAAGIISLALAPLAARAEPGDTIEGSGVAAAEVTEPTNIQHVEDLRFGRFFAPTVSSTIRILPNGNILPSTGVAGAISIAQPPEGRGTAEFRIEQDGNRNFIVILPTSIDITNGAATMRVDTFRDRQRRIINLGRDSVFSLDVGATLRINPNQAVGSYSGEFTVTVVYL